MTTIHAALPVPAGRRSWRSRFVAALGVALVVQSLGGAFVKVTAGRSDDLAHTVLHLVFGVLAAVAARRHRDTDARLFAAVFGSVYLLLAAVGWAGSSVVDALHLGATDHLFHVIVGMVSLIVAGLPSAAASRTGLRGDRRSRRAHSG